MGSNNSREGSFSAGFPTAIARVLRFPALVALCAVISSAVSARDLPGLTYTNYRDPSIPLSVHIVRVRLTEARYRVRSVHALGKAIGLDTLSDQVTGILARSERAVAAINGDFYEREGFYSGAPRGLQVMEGELISGPSGEAGFWMDAVGAPHAADLQSHFQLTWSDGTKSSFEFNRPRTDDGIVIYTSAIGASTGTSGGREIVLDGVGGAPWLPLRIGKTYKASVRESRDAGNTALTSNMVVLSIGAKAMARIPSLRRRDLVEVSTACEPPLHGIKTAIGGGPIILRNGHLVSINVPESQSYQVTTMSEGHPRAAIGWNDKYLFLVEVDGRQRKLSEGMTLDELARFLLQLGCTDAMNLDGGGSATLWFDGEVRNSPCDRMEREVANGLAIVMRRQ